MQPNSILAIVPSFTSYSSNQFAEIAAKVIREIAIEEQHHFDIPSFSTSDPSPSSAVSASASDDDDGDFEFTFVCENPDAPSISADELFANGQIRPLFPIFNRDIVLEDDGDDGPGNSRPSIRLPTRKLLTDDRDPISATSSSSSPPSPPRGFESEIPAGKYKVWTVRPTAAPAAPERCKKSNSTGSSKLWRFRDLLNRSSSDGKERFIFLSTSAVAIRRSHEKDKARTNNGGDEGKGMAQIRSPKSKGKSVSAHEIHYVTNRAMRESDRRRSYLPYRQDIVGFFANVNGLSKTLHPF